jgi:hypothetical protein
MQNACHMDGFQCFKWFLSIETTIGRVKIIHWIQYTAGQLIG